ncbi:DUF2470 domain-containing protein [Nonomuraea mangrovi]|uniref:DUF2470 domain-containing protein n=1 Tax=Nonomuraea mangrovi TaxID=2316207 RepID=A0ABW4SZY5_9ACTN
MPLAAPPLPERIRTLAATSRAAQLVVDGVRCPVSGAADSRGRPVLLVRPGEVLHGLRGDAVVSVSLAATRRLGEVEHPRGLIEVQGWAEAVPEDEAREAAVAISAHSADEGLFEALERYGSPEAPRLLRLDVGQVVYLTGEESGTLDADEYLDASPDPLAEVAEQVLAHVNGSHRPQLAAGVGRLLGLPAESAWLWELDRYGATVRLGDDDPALVRFPWPVPAGTGLCLETALRAILCTC